MRNTLRAVVPVFFSMCLGGPVAAERVSILERVLPVEVQTGVVRVRSIEAPLLEVPSEGEGAKTLWTERRFDRLYGFQFAMETRRRDGETSIEDRGFLMVAVNADAADLVRLDEAVRSHLAGLGANAFALPQAGYVEGSPPLDQLAAISVERSWTCVGVGDGSLRATSYERTLRRGADGRPIGADTETHGVTDGELPRQLCSRFERAISAASPSEVRTMPLPREVIDQIVWLEASGSLPSEARRVDLPVLPPGVRYARRAAGDGGYIESKGEATDGSRFESTRNIAGVEWQVTTVPSSFPPDLPAVGAWVGRFGFEQTERRLGTQPERKMTRETITVGLMPVAPPPIERDGTVPDAPDPLPVRLDTEALVAEIVHRLDGASSLDLALLENAVTREPAGLRSDGWLLVLCRGDGSASFGLPPAASRSAIRNASLFCAALESRLP